MYEAYIDVMYNTCFQMVNHTGDAEDIVQDAFIKAFTHLDSFQYKSTFGAWLKRIVVNQSINFFKKKKELHLDIDQAREMEEVCQESWPVNVSLNLIKTGIGKLSKGYQ